MHNCLSSRREILALSVQCTFISVVSQKGCMGCIKESFRVGSFLCFQVGVQQQPNLVMEMAKFSSKNAVF